MPSTQNLNLWCSLLSIHIEIQYCCDGYRGLLYCSRRIFPHKPKLWISCWWWESKLSSHYSWTSLHYYIRERDRSRLGNGNVNSWIIGVFQQNLKQTWLYREKSRLVVTKALNDSVISWSGGSNAHNWNCSGFSHIPYDLHLRWSLSVEVPHFC